MGVQEIHGDSEWDSALRSAGNKLVVADFSATWCGPCQFIKPIFHQMSTTYPDVVFLSVDEAANRSLIQSLGIRGFPTFHFYINRIKKDEIVGANAEGLKAKIEALRGTCFNPFAGDGMVMGGTTKQDEDPREARLRKFGMKGSNNASTSANATSSVHNKSTELSEDEQLARAIALSQQESQTLPAPKSSSPKKSKKITVCDGDVCSLKTVPVEEDENKSEEQGINEELMKQLLEMGFSEILCRKAILSTDGSLEQCISWIGEHQDDADINEPITKEQEEKMKKDSATKKLELQQLLIKRRKEREEEEKKRQQLLEIQRREQGKNLSSIREEIDAIQRKRELEKRKQEKLEAKRERARLLRQLENDKRERLARAGKLPSTDSIEEGGKNGEEADKAKKDLSPEEKIQKNIKVLLQYRTGGTGVTALRTLEVYVKNLIEKPEDDKFAHINLENAAFKKRVGCLVGGVDILIALGFAKNDEQKTLDLSAGNKNMNLLNYAKAELDKALRPSMRA